MIGHKGSGKTKNMVNLANDSVEKANGNIAFITKNKRLMYDLKHSIRVVCMEDYPHITNSDEYIGFIYGIISGDHDLEAIFIDGIMKHADFSIEDLPEYIDRLKKISELHEVNFIVSISADKEEMIGVDFSDCDILN